MWHAYEGFRSFICCDWQGLRCNNYLETKVQMTHCLLYFELYLCCLLRHHLSRGVLGFEMYFLCCSWVTIILRDISKTQGMKASFKVLLSIILRSSPWHRAYCVHNRVKKKHEQCGFKFLQISFDKKNHLAAKLSKRVTMVTGTSRSCTPLLPCLCFCSGQ